MQISQRFDEIRLVRSPDTIAADCGEVNSGNSLCGGLRAQGHHKYGTPGTPLISIITAVFNGGQVIEKCIESVRNQSYPNIEYLIVDGGSTDDSLDIIRKYQDSIDYWVSEPDAGIYDAFNKGLLAAQGEWICFLGSDDVLEKDAMLHYHREFLTRKEPSQLEYISGKAMFVDGDGKEIRTVGAPWEWRIFRKYMNTSHTGSLHHRSLFEKYGAYDTGFKIAGDYELLLRAGAELKTGYLDRCVTIEGMTGVSNASIKVFFEVHRAKVKNKSRRPASSAVDLAASLLKFAFRKFCHG